MVYKYLKNPIVGALTMFAVLISVTLVICVYLEVPLDTMFGFMKYETLYVVGIMTAPYFMFNKKS